MKILFQLNKENQQRQLEKLVYVYPALYAMVATHFRNQGNDVVWDGIDDGKFDKVYKNDIEVMNIPFENLPFPDRLFTDAENKRWQVYGNYKYHPATHMLSSNLCWYSKCTFCQDTQRIEQGEKRGVRSVDHVIEEIDNLITQGYKEVFDDSGTFPIGKWLEEFCLKMRMTHANGKRRCDQIKIGCNMRVQDVDWKMMKAAGFRFILMGVESANQITLDAIKKSQKAEDIVRIIKAASDAGLEPHGTFMTGYPWEGPNDEEKTIKLCHYLLRKGYLKTAQASVYSPPRTKPDPASPGHQYLPRFYDVYRSPEFWYHKIKDIKCWEDAKYLLRGVRLVVEEKWRKMWLKKSA